MSDALEFQAALEARARAYLDGVLEPRGFKLSPQGYGESIDRATGATIHDIYYETTTEEYARRYPVLDGRFSGDPGCIDLVISLDPSTSRLMVELEAEPLDDLLAEIDADPERFALLAAETEVEQFTAIAAALDRLLTYHDQA